MVKGPCSTSSWAGFLTLFGLRPLSLAGCVIHQSGRGKEKSLLAVAALVAKGQQVDVEHLSVVVAVAAADDLVLGPFLVLSVRAVVLG